MLAFKLILVAVTGVLGVAVPEPTAPAQLDARGVDCKKLNEALNVLNKLGPPASAFCRSYLNLPGTSTTVTLTTPATVTSTTSTTTVTVTSSSCPGQKRDVPAVHVDYKFESSEQGSWVLQKRTGILPQLHPFAAAKISDACHCLCLKPTATTTAISIAPAPTTNVVATATACVVSQPVCKASSFSNSCTSASECCTGLCGTQFGSSTCCNPSNGYCNLDDPAICCGGTCVNAGKGNCEGYCA